MNSGGDNSISSNTIKLPKTGQVVSYGARDDGALQIGITWPSPRFTVSTDGLCVLDNLTQLMWTKDASLKSPGDDFDYDEGLIMAYCSNLDYAGYADWRLPNNLEMCSLRDFGQYNPALPAGHPFINVQNGDYYTSTYITGYPGAILTVSFGSEAIYGLWPVRGP